jgi:hypothetical protein
MVPVYFSKESVPIIRVGRGCVMCIQSGNGGHLQASKTGYPLAHPSQLRPVPDASDLVRIQVQVKRRTLDQGNFRIFVGVVGSMPGGLPRRLISLSGIFHAKLLRSCRDAHPNRIQPARIPANLMGMQVTDPAGRQCSRRRESAFRTPNMVLMQPPQCGDTVAQALDN